jgi:hypothetical protein
MTWNGGGGGGGLGGEDMQDPSSLSSSSSLSAEAAAAVNFNSPTSALLPWVLFGPCALAACTFVRAATARRWLQQLWSSQSPPPSSSSSSLISPLARPSLASQNDESSHEIADGLHHFHYLERQHVFELELKLFWLERQLAVGASAPYCLLLMGGGLFQVE